MIIRVFNKAEFDKNMKEYHINDDNVEIREDVFFISINDSVGTTTETPYFKRNHENVLVLHFDDVTEDMDIPVLGTGYIQRMKAFKLNQANELYDFIIKNKDKKYCYIHCTAGINRSGAVAKYVNDVVGGDYYELMRLNPWIQGNPHVTALLNERQYRNHFLAFLGNEIASNPELLTPVTQSWKEEIEELLTPDEPRTFTLEQVKQIAHDVMNLGMTLRQNQLNGTDGRSGNEVLDEYLKGLE
jgi:predicted protein tyrosine phosphatase